MRERKNTAKIKTYSTKRAKQWKEIKARITRKIWLSESKWESEREREGERERVRKKR